MPTEPPELPGVKHRHVDVGVGRTGLSVHVAEAGSGPPLVLLHGWPQHWYAWRDVIPALAEHRRVICPDLRGMGWTDAPAGRYDKHQFAADLIGLLDALELARVGIVGHDWGGWTSLLAAAQAPERFTAVLALGIPHPWLPVLSARPSALARAAVIVSYQLPLSIPGLGPALVRRGFVRTMLRAARTDGRFTAAEIDAFDSTYREPARARASSALYRAFLTRELPAMARRKYEPRRVEVPVRMVLGGRDPVAIGPLDDPHGHLPDLQVERLPGVGHFIPEERPELVVEQALALPTA